MTLNTFIKKADLNSLQEIQKVEAIGFYMFKIDNVIEFSISSICEKLSSNGFGNPNQHRLKTKLLGSRSFVKGTNGFFKLHNSTVKRLEQTFSFLSEISDHIETTNSILPEDLYANTRGYIQKLAIQINASYENSISDGCAVLMRRLIEVLLILGYEAQKREKEIIELNSGAYKKLTAIIDYTLSNKVLPLQKDTTEVLHDFRILGNFSAHAIKYNCRKEELSKISRKYRLAIEDLLYAADLKK